MTSFRDSDSAVTTDVLFRDWARQSGVFSAQPDAPVVPDRPRRGTGVRLWLARGVVRPRGAADGGARPDAGCRTYPVNRRRAAGGSGRGPLLTTQRLRPQDDR